MRVLLYSSVLYLTGIALILYFRPALMFKNDGRWKEFGINGIDTTVCPLWLFCIVWAVVVYGLIRILYSDDSSTTAIVNSTAAVAANTLPNLTERLTPLGAEPTEEAKPGYYKLNSALMKKKGIPRYIYVGTEEPDDLD
jgi:hypothetical protein